MAEKITNAIIEDLQERREAIATELNDLTARTDDWTPEDEQRFEKIDGEYDGVKASLDKEIRKERAARLQDRIKADDERTTAAYRSEHGASRMERSHGRMVTAEIRSHALLAFARPGEARSEWIDAAESCGINPNAKELKVRMLQESAMGWDGDLCYSGRSIRKYVAEHIEERQQGTTPDAAGGFTVPDGMMQAIEVALLQFGSMRATSMVVRTADGREMPWPTTNDTGNVATIVAENSAQGQQDVVFGQITTKPYKYGSGYVPVSIELMQDSATNMESLLGRLLGERQGRGQNIHHTVGTGTGQPTGIVTAAADSMVVGDVGTINNPTYDNFIDLKHSVDPSYRISGQGYMFPDLILAGAKKLKSTDGFPLWKAGLAADAPDTIDGDPYSINQQIAVGADAICMLYGQLNKYVIHDAMDMVLRRLDELHALNGQVTFLSWARTDGNLLDAGTNPVKFFTNAST